MIVGSYTQASTENPVKLVEVRLAGAYWAAPLTEDLCANRQLPSNRTPRVPLPPRAITCGPTPELVAD